MVEQDALNPTPADPKEWLNIEKQRQKNEKYTRGHGVDANFVPRTDLAQSTGGIDLTSTNKYLQTKSSNGEIEFQLNPAMLARMKDVPGFVPQVIKIQPLKDLKSFMTANVTDPR